jgi:hypothetical protein
LAKNIELQQHERGVYVEGARYGEAQRAGGLRGASVIGTGCPAASGRRGRAGHRAGVGRERASGEGGREVRGRMEGQGGWGEYITTYIIRTMRGGVRIS